MEQATEHIWKTADGRLVRDGDQDAAVLAYAPGDEVKPQDVHAVQGLFAPSTESPSAKKVAKPSDKAAKPEGDK